MPRLSKTDIEQLIVDAVRESTVLEYKEELPGASRGDRKEFAADVSAFANTRGGTILYGVREQRDENGHPTGVPAKAHGLADINPEAEIARLESMVRANIQPRINGIDLYRVDGFSGGPAIVVFVPPSLSGLHMVGHSDDSRFWMRGAVGKRPLDVFEIRQAFVRVGGLIWSDLSIPALITAARFSFRHGGRCALSTGAPRAGGPIAEPIELAGRPLAPRQRRGARSPVGKAAAHVKRTGQRSGGFVDG